MMSDLMRIAHEVGQTSARLQMLSDDYSRTKSNLRKRVTTLEDLASRYKRIGLIVMLWTLAVTGWLESQSIARTAASALLKLWIGY